MLDRWSKKRRNENFLHKERDLIADMDKLLGIFCQDLSRKRGLEKQNNLRTSDRDYSFYEDQKDQRKQKCLDIVESSDLGDFFSQWHKGRKRNPVASSSCFLVSDFSTSSLQHHLVFSSETESVQSYTTNEYKNLTPLEKSQQNENCDQI